MDFVSAAILLFIIMDPLGNIPIFHALVGHYSRRQRLRIIFREMVIAYAILMLFLLAGETILGYLGLEQPALGVAGGVVLFVIALRMLFPDLGTVTGIETGKEEDPFIVPLAIPMIAGPSAVAALLLLVSGDPGNMLTWWTALTVAWGASAAILLTSGLLVELLGRHTLRALVRLSGMLLIMMAIQMLMNGIAGWLAGIS